MSIRSLPFAAALFLGSTASLLVAPPPLSAQDVAVRIAGAWTLEWRMETPRGVRAQTMIVDMELHGDSISGTARVDGPGRRGGGGDGPATVTVPLREGRRDGDDVRFVVVIGSGERSMRRTFRATVRADGMTGVMETPRGEVEFVGHRRRTGPGAR